MIFNCPGSQKFKTPEPQEIKCDNCGQTAEIWTDESQTTCPKCKKVISRNTGDCCLDWCKHARECVGPTAYDRYKANKKKEA